MHKKTLVISFIAILLVGAATPGLSIETLDEILYVDDDNTIGPWNGTPKHPYRYIQDAIDNSSDGYTVRVYAGIYDKNNYIDIGKTLSIIGNGSDTTIIECPVYISADHVIFSRFTVNGYDYETMKPMCCIKLNNANNCEISNNTFSTGLTALELYESHNSIISDNDISVESDKPTVYLFSSYNVVIKGNNITASRYGVYLDHCLDNLVDSNKFSGYAGARCIYVISGINSTISKNNFSECFNGITLKSSEDITVSENSFIRCRYSICLQTSFNNTIKDNEIKNAEFAIYLYASDNNLVTGNIVNKSKSGIYLPAYSCSNVVEKNNITNSRTGVSVSNSCNDNIVRQNKIANNRYGIFLYGKGNMIESNNIIKNDVGIFSGELMHIGKSNSRSNTIKFNNIQKNGNKSDPTTGGILLKKNSYDHTILWNNIEDNVNFGLNASDRIVNARFNWWGSPLGPSRSNSMLRGDKIISENSWIKIFSWLFSPNKIDTN